MFWAQVSVLRKDRVCFTLSFVLTVFTGALLIHQDWWVESERVDSLFGPGCWRCLVARSYVWFLQIWCFVAGAALFWAQGCVFYIGSSAVESARGEYFGGADGAHFYQDWSSEEKFGEQEFASDIVIDEFRFCRVLICSVFYWPFGLFCEAYRFSPWKNVLGTPMMY